MIYPNEFPAPSIIKPTGGVPVLYVDPDGVMYRRESTSRLSKSVDQADNWTEVHTFASPPGKVAKVAAGNLVVFLENGEIWRSDTDGANFAKVFETDSEASGIQNLEQYGNMMFCTSWGLPPNVRRNVAISKDYGATWAYVTPLPETTMNHTHAICYDPYEGLLWAACGDTPNGRRVYWSDNLGVTWQTNPNISHRLTCIMPFPDKVIFGSDEQYEAFTLEYNRVARGTSGTEIQLEKNWVPIKWINENFESTWAMRPAVVYGNSPMAYFGFRQAAGATFIPTVWQTDGKDYFPLWKHDHIPAAGVVPAGILGVWGPDKDNKIYAALATDIGGVNNHIVIIG